MQYGMCDNRTRAFSWPKGVMEVPVTQPSLDYVVCCDWTDVGQMLFSQIISLHHLQNICLISLSSQYHDESEESQDRMPLMMNNWHISTKNVIISQSPRIADSRTHAQALPVDSYTPTCILICGLLYYRWNRFTRVLATLFVFPWVWSLSLIRPDLGRTASCPPVETIFDGWR